MKKTIYLLLLAGTTTVFATSCGPKCKQCEAQVMSQKSGISQELCDDEL